MLDLVNTGRFVSANMHGVLQNFGISGSVPWIGVGWGGRIRICLGLFLRHYETQNEILYN